MTTVSSEQQQAVAGAQSDGSAVQKCAIIVVIDPGHGDRLKAGNPVDPGAVSGTIYESNIALDVGKKLKSKLEAKTDCIQAVYLTREGEITEVRPRLKWRVAIAKEKKANLFISLHLDAAGASASGQSALYHPSYPHSKTLASTVAGRAKIIKSRGAKSRDNLYVINLKYFGPDTKASILIELGFITNDADRNACQTQGDAIAQEIADSVADFVLANKAIFSATPKAAAGTPANVPIPRPRPTNR
ncbi:N-acetylmuramoyl-L-alanine amidase [Polyangium sp. y55x31]|uniref:N-acetylmuramoyl-L-alanine amidase n=1 Tax=Polyangium sp. y55x31 TaxID=3042688 RepID=UPI002482BF8B|nr:N-acetylmuramoyl-L-alanine amidase [Polyangium sp. y55x31]MDI1476805.1 N-acetylmuramoyl-L-alanine amidase [Polyangium sp. y55x31]